MVDFAYEKAGLRQSIRRYRLDPRRRSDAMAVQSPATTPRKADRVRAGRGVVWEKGLKTVLVTEMAAKKYTDTIAFLKRFNANADPCQFLSQNMNPIADAKGESRADPSPGVEGMAPPRERRKGYEDKEVPDRKGSCVFDKWVVGGLSRRRFLS
mmetsp:Transcript_42934/g.84342  ORF Transcript_42934/g.84342 Transcript_42934/m.84342 type:complete len:154 (+) Transcript_42934:856-1317(+)